MSHTPGPWRTFPGPGPRIRIIGPEDGTPMNAQVGETYGKAAEPNARLMAAAPDLLAALELAAELVKTARKHFPKSVRNSDRFQLENYNAAICAAIAKAKGGA